MLAALGAGIRDAWAIYTTEWVLHYDDGGGNERWMAWVEGGRAVLVGCDHECSYTYDWHPPPDRLPCGRPGLASIEMAQRPR
ncbi:hypothetical protein GCM10009799_04830 [Nocardiopsis rhodophaea]|uniref:Uncharacterized protein n=1 Tax=Nocardiopsis rhodophaea TaxID=280238 RepID=A0ABN2S9V9_9ACTN